MLSKINKYLFLTFIVVFCITFFTRNNFKNVSKILPEVLSEPIQENISDKKLIKFNKDGYAYELTPLYYYVINGLLVSKKDYRLFSIRKTDSVFPFDLCLIWGNNIKEGIYKDKTIKFSQDCRFCYVEWHGNVRFNFKEISNNHLLINNNGLVRKLKVLSVGDQVRIKGQLVNARANILGKPGQLDPQWMTWNTSITRDDAGAGACEVIFVEDIEIIKKANVISFYLFRISRLGLILLIIFNVIWFFAEEKFSPFG